MKQRLPVVRQLYWRGLLPQFVAIAAIDLVVYPFISGPGIGIPESTLIAAGAYWIFCVVMRRTLTLDFIRGIRAYRAGKFEESIEHYKRGYEFFTKHPWIDRFRFVLLGTASQNPYTTISLCNMAFSESQLGHGNRAIELYEQALKLTPGCAIAEVGLRMLRSTQSA
jgi:tetratricopeptide (TPR) repeat protein